MVERIKEWAEVLGHCSVFVRAVLAGLSPLYRDGQIVLASTPIAVAMIFSIAGQGRFKAFPAAVG
jgi:hypothetical protein